VTTRPSTPSQTVGPYLGIGLVWDDGPDVVADGTPGAIWLRGRVLDGAGAPVTDALVETTTTTHADPLRERGSAASDGARRTRRVPGRCTP